MDTKKLVRDLKNSSGMSVAQISEVSGLSTTSIENWLYAGVEPTVSKFYRYIEALGYKVEITKIEDDSEQWI